MLKTGIFGVGNLGKNTIAALQQLTEAFELVGFCDPCNEVAAEAAQLFKLNRFESQEALLNEVDCVIITTPSRAHFGIASAAIRKSKHVFVSQPLTESVEETKVLLRLADEANVRVQVGHCLRHHPAYIGALSLIHRPMLIETQRSVPFSIGGQGSVVLDLLIHDLDLVLGLAKSNVRRISTHGVAVVGKTHDIVSVRIEFDNGCVANLTASRVAAEFIHKTSVFQRNTSVVIDFLENSTLVSGSASSLVNSSLPFTPESFPKTNLILDELLVFHRSILVQEMNVPGIDEALRSIETATAIMDKLKTPVLATFDNI